MRKRSLIILLVVLAIAIAAVYGWNEFNRTNVSLVQKQPDYTVEAEALIHEFEQANTTVDKKYAGKLLMVNGTIKAIEKDERDDYTIVMGESGSMSAIRCSMDSVFREEAASLKAGETTSVKGLFTGYQKDETGLLGSDIILNRAVLVKSK